MKHYWGLEYLKVTVSSRTAILCICKQCVVVDPGFCVGLDQRDKIHGIVKAKGTTTAYSVLGSRGHFLRSGYSSEISQSACTVRDGKDHFRRPKASLTQIN
jgi:hypothetical protein